MTTVLVTGNLGYNGAGVVRTLREAGHHVVGVDTEYFRAKLYDDGLFQPDEQLRKDVRRMTADDLTGIDTIVHLAGLSNDALGEIDPCLTNEINADATLTLARLAKSNGVRKFIFVSSCSIYGIHDPKEMATEDSPVAPLTAYARAKVDAENGLLPLHDPSFHVGIMRCATMHGPAPRLRLDLVVNKFVARALAEGDVHTLSDGAPWRPLLSVDDFARITRRFVEHDLEHVVYNVGFDDENHQVRDIARAVSDYLGVPLDINPTPTPDERSYRVSFRRLRDEFPTLRPVLPLRNSIAALAALYSVNGLTKEDFRGPSYVRMRTLRDLLERGALTPSLYWSDATSTHPSVPSSMGTHPLPQHARDGAILPTSARPIDAALPSLYEGSKEHPALRAS